MIYLSATSIKDYIECPQRYFFRINKSADAGTNQDMIAGTVVHTILEKFWDKEKKYALLTAISMCETNNLDKVKTKKVTDSIECYYSNFSNLLSPDDKVEQFFSINLSQDVVLKGKIDRICLPSGHLIDWKTSTETPRRIDNDIQFLIYYCAYWQMYGREPSLVSFVSLSSGRMVNLSLNRAIYDELFDSIIPSMVYSIKRELFPKHGLFNGKCYFCQFKDICKGNGEADANYKY